MARPVDAEDLIRIASEKKMTEVFPNWKELSSETRNAIGAFGQYWKSLIEDAPTIEAEPVNHGKWVVTHIPDVFQCDYCKKATKMDELCDSEILRAYCPNCGARMDGSVKSESCELKSLFKTLSEI
ncbi:hypothetical protein [Anaerotignum sp.]